MVVDGEFKWTRKDSAVQMPAKPNIRTNGGREVPCFDTKLALQNRVMVNQESLIETFQYELSDYPPALFANGLMRDPGKTKFSKYLNVKRGEICHYPIFQCLKTWP